MLVNGRLQFACTVGPRVTYHSWSFCTKLWVPTLHSLFLLAVSCNNWKVCDYTRGVPFGSFSFHTWKFQDGCLNWLEGTGLDSLACLKTPYWLMVWCMIHGVGVCAHAHTHPDSHTYKQTQPCVHVHARSHACTHTHMHAHAHTHTRTHCHCEGGIDNVEGW